MERRVRYARLGEHSIAYDVLGGEAEVHVLLVPAMVSHIELMWGDPGVSRFLRRLSSFARVIVYDKLGTGLSDPIVSPPSIEDRAREAQAVMDAAGVDRAAVMGLFDGGVTAVMLAATRPERVEALVLYGTHPVGASVHDAPEWKDHDWTERFRRIEDLVEGWGDGRTLSYFSGIEPSAMERQFWSTFERASASPGMVRAMVRELGERDMRTLLGHVSQPTLVLHPAEDQIHPFEQARFIADRLPDARLVPVGGNNRWPWSADPETVLLEIRAHLTGVRAAPRPATTFATVLFTDVVASTELAAELGDDPWRERVERLDQMTRQEVAARGGRYIKSTGDGSLVVFDGPAHAIRCARTVLRRASDLGLTMRAGLHAGEVEELHTDVRGLTVHVAAKICDQAGPGEVLVSASARDVAAGSALELVDERYRHLPGIPEPLRLFRLGHPEPATDLGDPGCLMRFRDRAAVALTRKAPAVTRFFARLRTET